MKVATKRIERCPAGHSIAEVGRAPNRRCRACVADYERQRAAVRKWRRQRGRVEASTNSRQPPSLRPRRPWPGISAVFEFAEWAREDIERWEDVLSAATLLDEDPDATFTPEVQPYADALAKLMFSASPEEKWDLEEGDEIMKAMVRFARAYPRPLVPTEIDEEIRDLVDGYVGIPGVEQELRQEAKGAS